MWLNRYGWMVSTEKKLCLGFCHAVSPHVKLIHIVPAVSRTLMRMRAISHDEGVIAFFCDNEPVHSCQEPQEALSSNNACMLKSVEFESLTNFFRGWPIWVISAMKHCAMIDAGFACRLLAAHASICDSRTCSDQDDEACPRSLRTLREEAPLQDIPGILCFFSCRHDR